MLPRAIEMNPGDAMPRGQRIIPRARLLTILAAWQSMTVVAGYITARLVLKHCDEFCIKHHLQYAPVLTRVTLFIRDFGFWFAFAPLIWLVIALRPRRLPPDAQRREPSYLGGIVLAALLTIVFAVAGLYALRMLFAPIVT